jgi:hypothetical protein
MLLVGLNRTKIGWKMALLALKKCRHGSKIIARIVRDRVSACYMFQKSVLYSIHVDTQNTVRFEVTTLAKLPKTDEELIKKFKLSGKVKFRVLVVRRIVG